MPSHKDAHKVDHESSKSRSNTSHHRKKGKKIRSNKDTLKITSDQLNFLRQAEQENDIDVGIDEFGIGLVEKRMRKKKSKSKSKGLKLSRQKGSQKFGGHQNKVGIRSSLTSSALADVADDLREVGTNSTSEQSSVTIVSRKPVEKNRFSARLQAMFNSISGKEQKVYPLDDKRDSDARRVSTEHARKIRAKLGKSRKRVEHITYDLLVAIIIIRLITTLTIIYEYEEFSITLEYLLRLRKLNCLEVYDWITVDVWPLILLLYFTACCILPTLTSRELTKACIVWMLIQILYTGHRFFISQQYFFFREFFESPLSTIAMFIGHCILDVLSFTTVMVRYYYWANPCLERDRYSNTMLGDYLVNEYIQFMVQSSFIRKKTAVQRATAFQVMTVVRKLKEKYRSSGDGPSESAIQKEVNSAIHALQDWKKFPALRIIHSFEVKEKIMKEKLKLRRQRIREMKKKFHKLLEQQKKKDAGDKRKDRDLVVLNQQGQAVGIKANENSHLADVIRKLKAKKQQSYQNKRNALMKHAAVKKTAAKK
ncbi:unnamed protein product [Allacma fusca]|uniref:Uncharacterized protein n=1 Tax=Allacma fusca TaxID=39272 RepID=A0A8J2LKD5_9HEXA|nr:unnamed protein product [Allacma fusca]